MNKPSEQNPVSNTLTAQDNMQETVVSSKAVAKADAKPVAQRYTLHVRPRDPIDAPLTAIPTNGATKPPVAN